MDCWPARAFAAGMAPASYIPKWDKELGGWMDGWMDGYWKLLTAEFPSNVWCKLSLDFQKQQKMQMNVHNNNQQNLGHAEALTLK